VEGEGWGGQGPKNGPKRHRIRGEEEVSELDLLSIIRKTEVKFQFSELLKLEL
jgi:hypothetical protein